MFKQITLSLPEDVYRQVQQVAMTKQSNVTDVLLDTISDTFAPYPANPNRAAMKKEIAAYKTIHAELVKKYLGQYVALYQGKLVAHDADPVALHRRITAKYPGEVVLCRKVQEEAEPVLYMRSPRLERLS
jgi:hypothetical protein